MPIVEYGLLNASTIFQELFTHIHTGAEISFKVDQ